MAEILADKANKFAIESRNKIELSEGRVFITQEVHLDYNYN